MRFLLPLFLVLTLPVRGAMIGVRVPISSETAAARTNISSLLVLGINDYSTNAFATNSPALANFLSLGEGAQVVLGPKVFNSISGTNAGLVGGIIDGATITNTTLSGTLVTLANGLWTGGTLVSPVFTNAVNYGNPFSSPGAGSESQQFGQSAEALAANTTAVGDGALAKAAGATSFGSQATVETNAPDGLALGFKAAVTGGAGISIGNFAESVETNSIAIGVRAISIHTNSAAFGNDVATSAANQIRLGTSAHSLSVSGNAAFGQKLAVGSDNYVHWPTSLNRGIAFSNGSSAEARATNSWVLFGVSSEPFYRTGSTGEGAEQNNRLHNRGATVTGAGSDYALTASTERIDLGGQEAEAPLPSAGTYFVSALVEVVNGATANDEYHVKLRNFEDDLDITDSERVISNLPASTIGQLSLQNVITVNDAKTIVLWAHNATAARGTIAAVRTSITYVRLY